MFLFFQILNENVKFYRDKMFTILCYVLKPRLRFANIRKLSLNHDKVYTSLYDMFREKYNNASPIKTIAAK